MSHTHDFQGEEMGFDEQAFGGHTHRVFGNFFSGFAEHTDGLNSSVQKGGDNDGHTHTVKGVATGPANPSGFDLFRVHTDKDDDK